MNLEIGMYVRTINGKIWIITSQKAISGHRKNIINASYNIIDLIEVGDYVDRLRVVDKEDDYIVVETFDERIIITKEDTIKSIITKEQFESMEYKVKE